MTSDRASAASRLPFLDGTFEGRGRWINRNAEGVYGVRWTDPEPGLHYTCSVDGGPDSPCDQQLSIRVGEGEHELRVGAIDASGNRGPLTHHRWVRVETGFAMAPLDGAQLRFATFAARSDSGDDFECSVDSGPYRQCGSASARGALTHLTLPALADGRHTLGVRARNGSDYDLYPATRTWTIDTTPPDTVVRPTATGFELSSNESGVIFRCRVDNGGFGRCDSPYTLRTLNLGPHTFEAFAIDRAGNMDPTMARHAWTIVAPAVAPPTTPKATPTPAPSAVAVEPVTVESATAAPVIAAAPQRLAFRLRHALRKGRLTTLAVTDLTMRADLRVMVKCTARRGCPRGFAKWNVKRDLSLTRLVGKRLPRGTTITVRARAGALIATRSITIR